VISLNGQPPNVRSFNSLPGVFFTEVWSTSASPVTIDNGGDASLATTTGLQPPSAGSVIRVVDIPPEDPHVGVDPEAAKTHFAEIGAASASTAAQGRHGLMHRTETVDYGIVVEGSVTLVLDDSEVELAQGDIVVQRGTNHAWSNRSGKLCRIAFILLDGRYTPQIQTALDARSR
jgi:quercetin dioxygenase-like cupin family protein